MKLTLISFLAVALVGPASAFAQSETTAAPGQTPRPTEVRKKAREVLGILPLRMYGAEQDTPAMVELGRKLFLEKRLSVNETQSCNTCHSIDKNGPGVDGQKTSAGALGKRGTRNSPTVLNAGFNFCQFWDGRAVTLEDQAKGPLLNPIEMGMPSEQAVVERLSGIKEYASLFARAFPNDAEKITCDNVGKAIAAFERTLITRDRFDDFQRGYDQALSALELQGLSTFLEIGCTTCHNSSFIGGNTFQKVGLINPFENTADVGRFEITKDDSDKFKFKVPSLRNVALTAPYFHDGSSAKLEDAVTKMAWMQLGRKLTDEEVKGLVAFLEALSDNQRAKAIQRASAK